MTDERAYAVYLYPQAIEALGAAIKPYLADPALSAGAHLLCSEIDTGGALVEMTVAVKDAGGKTVMTELMLPGSMLQMVVSVHTDGSFGFVPRVAGAGVLDHPKNA